MSLSGSCMFPSILQHLLEGGEHGLPHTRCQPWDIIWAQLLGLHMWQDLDSAFTCGDIVPGGGGSETQWEEK